MHTAYNIRADQCERHARHFVLGSRVMWGAGLWSFAVLMLACAAMSAVDAWVVRVAAVAAGLRVPADAQRTATKAPRTKQLDAPVMLDAVEHEDGVGLVIGIGTEDAARLVEGGSA